MKKILRLVTTSVLTLTLVACGEASSSVASSTPASSVSSSVTSTYATVTKIDLSAATDSLTQTLGAQKTVVVTATLSANANPATAVEWFVDGAKSNQTGRVFEFTPAKAGAFVISARVGSVNSTNTYTVNVGAGSFAITGEVKVVDNNTIEVVAPGGATVAVTNNELLPASLYDIKEGKYVIELKTALVQGGSATVTLTRDGLTASKLFTFDTRKVDLAITGQTAKADGSFEITRPHNLTSVTASADNTTIDTYVVGVKVTNLKSASAEFKVETLSKPVGAIGDILVPTTNGQIEIASDAETSLTNFTFKVDNETVPGTYEYQYTVSGVSKKLTVLIKDPVETIALVPWTANVNRKAADGAAVASTYSYDVKYTQTWATSGPSVGTSIGGQVYGVAANTDGSYDVVKDFFNVNTAGLTNPASNEIYKTVEFRYKADNFDVPANFLTQTETTPNQLSVTVLGPNGLNFVRIQSGLTQNVAFQTPIGFRAIVAAQTVTQIVDATTPVGAYTYTIKVTQSGVEILNKKVVINVKAPEAKLEFTGTSLNPTRAWLDTAIKQGADIAAITTAEDPTYVKLLAGNVAYTHAIAGVDTPLVHNIGPDWGTGVAPTGFGLLSARPLIGATGGADTNTYYATDEGKLYTVTAGTPSTWNVGVVIRSVATLPNDNGAATPAALVNTDKVFLTGTGENKVYTFVDYIWKTGTAFGGAVVATTNPVLVAQALGTVIYNETDNKFYAVVDSASQVAIEIKNDIFEIEKPRAVGLDDLTLRFSLNVYNLQSLPNAQAAGADSFTNPINQLRTGFLTFKKTAFGPAAIDNNATANTADTKIGIVAPRATALSDELTLNLADAVTTYKLYGTQTNLLAISDVFTFPIRFLSASGDYVFTVQIGTLSKTVTVKVKDPVAKINFAVVTGGNFTKNATDGKFYSSQATPGGSRSAALSLSIDNVATSSEAPYILEVTDNLGNVVRTQNTVATTAKVGNDGVVESTAMLALIDSDNSIVFSTPGTYVYKLTLNGLTESITFVLEKYPTITVETVNIGTSALGKFGDNYLVPAPTGTNEQTINIKGAAVNLPASVYARVILATTTPATLTVTDNVTADNVATDSTNYSLLNLSTGLNVKLIGTGGLLGATAAAATSSTLDDKVAYLDVGLFTRSAGTNASTHKYTLIGHIRIPVWYKPTAA
jgi:hypothetical protein